MGGQLRLAGVQSLLKQLARKASQKSEPGAQKPEFNSCLCLVTTREPLTDLADFQRRQGSAWGSVLRVDLGNLTDEAGAALLHHAGASRAGAAEIKPDDKELLTASRKVDGHALTLNLLGRFLARAHGGDIRRRDLVKFEEADHTGQGGSTFRVLAAFETWFAGSGQLGARQLTLLRLFGLFDGPADVGCIVALRQPPAIAGLTDPLFESHGGLLGWGQRHDPIPEPEVNTAISFLSDFGLVTIHSDPDKDQRAIDCHPLIREYFAAQVLRQNQPAWVAAHARLCRYLRDSTPQKPEPGLDDIQPLYAAVTHGCHAGLYEEVLEQVFLDRIRRGHVHHSVKVLGAFGNDLAALASFFKRPWDTPVDALPADARAFLLGEAFFCLLGLGRLQEAVRPQRLSLEYAMERGQIYGAGKRAGDLAELLTILGRIEEGVNLSKLAVDMAERLPTYRRPSSDRERTFIEDTEEQRIAACHWGHTHVQAGRTDVAGQCFAKAEELFRRLDVPPLFSRQDYQYCDYLLLNAERCAWKLQLGIQTRALDEVREMVDKFKLAAADEVKSHMDALVQSLRTNRETEFGRAWQSVGDAERFLARATDGMEFMRQWSERHQENELFTGLLAVALDKAFFSLVRSRFILYSSVMSLSISNAMHRSWQAPGPAGICPDLLKCIEENVVSVLDGLRHSAPQPMVPLGLLVSAQRHCLAGNAGSARTDLDEAWDIAARGPMRLHLADIHLHRARLFFRERVYPWESPQDDVAEAEKLIKDCGYHRRDEELADAKRAILDP